MTTHYERGNYTIPERLQDKGFYLFYATKPYDTYISYLSA